MAIAMTFAEMKHHQHQRRKGAHPRQGADFCRLIRQGAPQPISVWRIMVAVKCGSDMRTAKCDTSLLWLKKIMPEIGEEFAASRVSVPRPLVFSGVSYS